MMETNQAPPRQNKKDSKIAVIILIAALIIGAWIHFSTNEKSTTWQEEVLLSDGSIAVIERTVSGKYVNDGWGHTGFEETSQTVKITGTELPQWEDKWIPLLIDKDKSGVWYLIVIPFDCVNWNDKFPYLQYKLLNGQWQRVKFDMTLDGRSTNLIWNYSVGEMPKLIKLSEKPFRIRGSGMYPTEFKIIKVSSILC